MTWNIKIQICSLMLLLCVAKAAAQKPSYGLQLPIPEKQKAIPLLAGAGGSDFQLTNYLAKDLSGKMPPVLDQGDQSSCVGWCLAYYLRSFQHGQYRNYSFLLPDKNLNTKQVFSPTYLYNTYKLQRKEYECKTGMTFFDAIMLVYKTGYASLYDEPYNSAATDGCYKQAPKSYSYATGYGNVSFYRLPIEVNIVRKRLNDSIPVVMGISIDKNFINLKKGNDVYNYTGEFVDYHAVLCVGFDDTRKMFKIINSMGTKWGDNGYFYLPYSMLNATVEECYTSYAQYIPKTTYVKQSTKAINFDKYAIWNIMEHKYEIFNKEKIGYVNYDSANAISYFSILDKDGNAEKLVPVYNGESTRVNIGSDLSYIFTTHAANSDSAQVKIEQVNTSGDSDIDRIELARERILKAIENNKTLDDAAKAKMKKKVNLQ